MAERLKPTNGNGNGKRNGNGDTVTVALKWSSGIWLIGWRMEESVEPSPAGGRKIEVAREIGRHFIRGYARGLERNGKSLDSCFALTYGVPRDLWDNWLKFNHDSWLVKEGLIFATSHTDNSIDDQIKDHDHIRTGFEPLQPSERTADGKIKHHDPRLRTLGNSLLAVTKADEQPY